MLKIGTAIPAGDGVIVAPDSAGKIFLELPVSGQQLDSRYLLTLSFDGPSPQRLFVIWQSNAEKGKVLQAEVAPPPAGTSTFDLSGTPGWNGIASTVGLGFRMLPGQEIKVHGAFLSSPTLKDTFTMYWYSWIVSPPWRYADINFLRGSNVRGGPYPVPFFAGCAALGLAVLGVFYLLRWGIRPFSWRLAGGVILLVWVVSDTFWHARLWRQAALTWETFGGKTTAEKLLASQDAVYVALTQNARKRIQTEDARIFIASADDFIGMISAYYMSPLNTYWHRKGPELPEAKYFASGDYILIIRPSMVAYDPVSGVIRLPGEADLKVKSEYSDENGVLLRVI